MLNKGPIFINALSRGGSSILLNMLRSHPGVCSPRGETHEVFRGKPSEGRRTKILKRLNFLPIQILEDSSIFNIEDSYARSPTKFIPGLLIDRVLFKEKIKAIGETQNRYKKEGVLYSKEEVRESRLLCKNLDGIVACSELFENLYHDATFLALIRNGFAVCEGHIRRGKTVKEVGMLYKEITRMMIDDSSSRQNYHLIKYEDIVEGPVSMSNKIFNMCLLDPTKVSKYRLVVSQKNIKSAHAGGDGEILRWYSEGAFNNSISDEYNKLQITKLPAKTKKDFLKYCYDEMKFFNYI